MRLRSVYAALLSLLVASACSGGPAIPPLTQHGSASARSGSLVVRVKVPKRRRGRHTRFISPATQAMTVSVAGPTPIANKVIGLTPASHGCDGSLGGTICTVTIGGLAPCPKKGNCYTATLVTYDAYDSATNTIPPTANKLSAAQSIGFPIVTGVANTFKVTLDGIPSSVVLVPNGSSVLTGTPVDKQFTFPKCNDTAQTVSVYGVDADGNYIVGAGAPAVSLATDNSAQLAVATPKPLSPNAFTLDPPVAPQYPYGNQLINLTATATPGTASGAAAATAHIRVTYSGDICGIVDEFSLPSGPPANPGGIAAGPDGKLWFTECTANKIGTITTLGAINVAVSPTTASTHPKYITAGPDGAMWFTENGGGGSSHIGRITTGGALNEYLTKTADSGPVSIVAGPDKTLWFTEPSLGDISNITTTGAPPAEYHVSGTAAPQQITVGPDLNLWFTDTGNNAIGTSTTLGAISENITLPISNAGPQGIANVNGQLWFALTNAAGVGTVTVTGNSAGFFAVGDLDAPYDAVAGPDGGFWVVDPPANAVVGFASNGVITQAVTIPTGSAQPNGIALGPDGALWVTEIAVNKIARIR
ncbi:MAG: hypothetical protein JO029_15455 [Candidatus Eremiobacteraeota bacterium]|nr:hypothetical protein [Candidatus Eremiobacteraeota bacterium]